MVSVGSEMAGAVFREGEVGKGMGMGGSIVQGTLRGL